MDQEIDVIINQIHVTRVRNILLNRLLIVVTILIFGCSRNNPSDPMCRTNVLYTQTEPSAAACLIKSNVQLLVIKNPNNDGWVLPFNKQQNLLSAQCTAHHAVWESTGLNVEVGQLLFTASNQTQYFECKLTDEFSRQLDVFPVPPWAQSKTSKIALIDPFETEPDQWVNDINLIKLREAYNKLE